nr:MAG TPA: hypothetical protein [Caudoviricetes sp.]
MVSYKVQSYLRNLFPQYLQHCLPKSHRDSNLHLNYR